MLIYNLAIFSTDDIELVRTILNCKNNKLITKVIVTNKPNSPLIDLAKKHNLNYKCFNPKDFPDRVSHEKDIVRFLKKEKIDLIIFAHYMRLITQYFVKRFKNKIINVHPSLLPNFKGSNCYLDAFEAGVKESGCTLHYVDKGLDTGEIILQKKVRRLEDDDFYSFKNRVHEIECKAIQTFVNSMVV